MTNPYPRSSSFDMPLGPAMVGRRLSAAGGVAISGVDLSPPLSPELKNRILRAVREYHFVVFADQVLSREQQYALAASFGEVEGAAAGNPSGKRHTVAHVISNLDSDGNPVDRSWSAVSNYRWHTDKAYRAVPPMMTVLYAVELPPRGGDTEFANTAMGYDALPSDIRHRIGELRVVFQWGASRPAAERGEVPSAASREHPAVDHPLVRTHPETGRKALCLGNHASHILGMPRSEGEALLEELLRHTTQPQFVYAHRWREGDLVMWDNRCLLHRAVANYEIGKHRRVLHRSVIRGTVPY